MAIFTGTGRMVQKDIPIQFKWKSYSDWSRSGCRPCAYYELCIKSPMRFGEVKKVLKPITNTALTNALKELEADDLIERIQYNEMPLRVEYSLTQKGRDLLPVFYAIMQWGIKYIP